MLLNFLIGGNDTCGRCGSSKTLNFVLVCFIEYNLRVNFI